MNKENLIVCIDLDDTLIDDNYKFELTFCDCIKVILEAFETRAPQIDEVLQLARNIDNENLVAWPADKRYTPERLKVTWTSTYTRLCEQHHIEKKQYIYTLLEGLVVKNYDPPYFIIPGAIETLTTLEMKGYNLHLVTAGTKLIQNRKVNSTGMSKFFREIHVVEDGEKKDILQSLVNQYGQDRIVMIGNSMRSDINPALELGIKAIHIPRGSWHVFNAEPINKEFITIEDITDLVGVIESFN